MSVNIGIQHDENIDKDGRHESFSGRWLELAKKSGVNTLSLDVYSSDFFQRLRQCDGFMWRVPPDATPLQYAKRLIPSIERNNLNIHFFPNTNTLLHHEVRSVSIIC